jgi:hypothetical protein
VCVDENGEHERNMRIEAPDGDADPWVVAETQYFSQRGMEAANARLIAAALEMAEALEAIGVLLNELQPHMTPEIMRPERWNELAGPALSVNRRIRGDAT